jgi:hypothetical protein
MRCFAAGTVQLRFTAALKLEVFDGPLGCDGVHREVAATIGIEEMLEHHLAV